MIKSHVTPLTHQELAEANLYIGRSNKTLKRNIFGLSPYATELLQRNYWIIKKAKCIYAFGEFEGSSPEHLFGDYTRVKGGTGWAVQMGMDFGMEQKGVYVYNTRDHRWYEQKWTLRQPPIVNESYTFFYPMKFDCAPSLERSDLFFVETIALLGCILYQSVSTVKVILIIKNISMMNSEISLDWKEYFLFRPINHNVVIFASALSMKVNVCFVQLFNKCFFFTSVLTDL